MQRVLAKFICCVGKAREGEEAVGGRSAGPVGQRGHVARICSRLWTQSPQQAGEIQLGAALEERRDRDGDARVHRRRALRLMDGRGGQDRVPRPGRAGRVALPPGCVAAGGVGAQA